MNVRADSGPLSQSAIFKLYLPLAFSWVFMALEAPICQSVLSRLPEPTLNTAAFLIVMTLSIWIESPVIDLLSTSTTLVKDRAGFRVVRRFALALMALVTLAHALIVFTPVYWAITLGAMQLPRDVAECARLGMMIMVPWSAFIGWRRFLQGVMISRGQTKQIGFSTLSRVVMVTLTSGALFFAFHNTTFDVAPMAIVTIALVVSVAVEAGFVHLVSRPIVRELPESAPTPKDLSTRSLVKFHAPLTGTTMVMLIGGPLVSAALSRATNPVDVLAGWQVAMVVTFLHRTIVFALPEVVITLAKDGQSVAALRKFCVTVGCFASGSMVLMAATGGDAAFFRGPLHAEAGPAHQAHLAYLAAIGLPIVGAIQSYLRGMLTKEHLTTARLVAILIGIGTLVAGLGLIVTLKMVNVVTASIALQVAMLIELGTLAWFWKHRGRRVKPELAVAAS